jgi:flap endonuclease-1
VSLIKEHKSIEKILETIDTKKHTVPESWPYQQARELFKNPDVTSPQEIDLKWRLPDEEGIIKFLVTDRGFNEERIRNGVQKLSKSKKNASQR